MYLVSRIQICVIWAALSVISRVQKLINGIPAQPCPHIFKVTMHYQTHFKGLNLAEQMAKYSAA